MNSKILILILAVSMSALFSACTKAHSESVKSEEVVIDEGYKSESNEIVISDADFQNKSVQTSTSGEMTSEGTRTLTDNSQIETLIDGFGNKTETRYFPGHPRLRFIVLRTSVDGTKTVTAYGYGSDTVTLPDLGDKALTASPDEIANAGKLYVTQSFKDTPENFMKKGKGEQLQPLPSSAIQVRPQPIEPVVTTDNSVSTEEGNSTDSQPETASNENAPNGLKQTKRNNED